MRVLWLLLAALALAAVAPGEARAQLDENCTVCILNRCAQVNPNGTFAIPNVPVEAGLFRVRATCERDGETQGGQTELIQLTPNGATDVGDVPLGDFQPIPISLTVVAQSDVLTERGETIQLIVIGVLPGNQAANLTLADTGTFYQSANTRICTVDANGRVTAQERGRCLINIRNEGVLASVEIDVLIPNDADGDGMPDEFETANGLNPNDPSDTRDVRSLGQQPLDVLGGNVTLDDVPVDQRRVAGEESPGHVVVGLDRRDVSHVGRPHRETVVLEMFDPSPATPSTG